MIHTSTGAVVDGVDRPSRAATSEPVYAIWDLLG